jgi:hypothetical protein
VNKVIAFIVFVFIGLAVGYYFNSPKWSTFSSSEDHFTVEFPGSPEKSVDMQGAGNVTAELNFYQVNKRIKFIPMSFTVAVSILKDGSGGEGYFNEESVLNAAKQGAIEKTGGEVVSETEVEMASVKAKEFYIRTSQANIASRLLMNGNRMYNLIVTYPVDKRADKMAERFFSSFKLM